MSEQTQPTQPQEQKPEEPTLGLPAMLEQLKGAGPKPTPSEIALLLAQIQAWDSERYRRWKAEEDEKWRRWKEEQEEKKKEKEKTQNALSEQLEKINKRLDELEKRLTEGKKETEIPDWAKAIQEEVQAIRKRFKEEEEKERDRRLIEEHQRPLLEKLREAESKYSQLEKALEELKKAPLTPQQSTSLNEALKQVKELLSDIRETGKLLGLKEPEEVHKGTFEGIPVKGEVPAAVVYVPAAIEKILDAIEKRAEKLGLTELLTPRKKTEEIQGPLIKLPPPPTPQPKPIEFTPIVQPQPVLPQTFQPQAPPEPPKVELTVSTHQKEEKAKTYKCKTCGAEFNKPYKLAAHVKKHRREEKRQQLSQKQTLNTPTK
jgi:hypothetical protein